MLPFYRMPKLCCVTPVYTLARLCELISRKVNAVKFILLFLCSLLMGFILENLSGFSTLNGCHAAPNFLPRLLMLARLSSLTVCVRSGIKECGQLLCVALKRFILQNINDGCVRPMEFYIDRRKIVMTHRLSILSSAAYFTRV